MKNMTLSLDEKQIAWLQVQQNASECVRSMIRERMKKEGQAQLDIPSIEGELSKEDEIKQKHNEINLLYFEKRNILTARMRVEYPELKGDKYWEKIYELAQVEGML